MALRQQFTYRLLVLAVFWLSVGVPFACVLHCATTTAIPAASAVHSFLCDPAGTSDTAADHTAPPITPQTLHALMLVVVTAAACCVVAATVRRAPLAPVLLPSGLPQPPLLAPPR